MKVFYAIPTANPSQCAETFARWKEMGYSTAALVDRDIVAVKNADLTIRIPEWLGYPHAIRVLCERLDESVIATGGDDMLPDPNKRPEEIAAEFLEHFPDTYGVMQPTGDPQGTDASGKSAAGRICGSPWVGRDYYRRINGGKGLFWPGYGHFYADEEARLVAEGLGVMWDRPDLCQLHQHWSFTGKLRPVYMEKAQAKWGQDEALFRERKAAGFPGHEPLQAALSI